MAVWRHVRKNGSFAEARPGTLLTFRRLGATNEQVADVIRGQKMVSLTGDD